MPTFNGKEVDYISSRLDTRAEFDPVNLPDNEGKQQRGVNPRGPFQIDSSIADMMFAADDRNREVVLPFLDGNDLARNGRPSRYIINFGNMTKAEAQSYPEPFRHVEKEVLPFREALKDKKEYKSLKDNWWQYEFLAKKIDEWFENNEVAFAKSRVASRWMFTKIDSGWVCGEATVIFFFEEAKDFAILQSALHEHWAKVFTSTLGSQGVRYTNICFKPFPFPRDASDESVEYANSVGNSYIQMRDDILKERECTYNELYRLLDDNSCTDGDITEFREQTIKLDKSVLSMYGWGDIDYTRKMQMDNDKSRFWAEEEVIEEVLGRLIELNRHQSQLIS